MKPFTTLASILLAVVALAQAARAVMNIDVAIDGFHVPIVASWVAAAVAAFMSVMLFREARH